MIIFMRRNNIQLWCSQAEAGQNIGDNETANWISWQEPITNSCWPQCSHITMEEITVHCPQKISRCVVYWRSLGSKIIIRDRVLHSYWLASRAQPNAQISIREFSTSFCVGGQLWTVDIINPNESDLTLCLWEEYHKRLVSILSMLENYYILCCWVSGK